MALGKGILCDSVVISYMAKCGEIHQPSIFCNSVVNSDLAISGHPTDYAILLAIYAMSGDPQNFAPPLLGADFYDTCAILYSKVAGTALGKGIFCKTVVCPNIAMGGVICQSSVFCNSVVYYTW